MKIICEKRVTVAEPECWYNRPDVRVILGETVRGINLVGVRVFL